MGPRRTGGTASSGARGGNSKSQGRQGVEDLGLVSTSVEVSAVGDTVLDTTIIHERFGDVTNELIFDGLYKITQVVIGAVPAGGGMTGEKDVSTIHVFGRVRGGGVSNGSSGSAARFQCLYEGLRQPEAGTVTVPMHGVVSRHLVLRGTYQTVPVKVYGWNLGELADRYVEENAGEGEEAAWDGGVSLVGRDLLVERGGGTEFVGRLLKMGTESESSSESASASEKFEELAGELAGVVGRVYRSEFGRDLSRAGAPCGGKEAQKAVAARMCDLKVLANKGISYVSALFAVLHAGSAPGAGLVSLGSAGLDLMVLALQEEEIAREFVRRGGCAVLRCVLSTRGVPGSFYDKALALVAEVVRQAGAVGVQGLLEMQWTREPGAWEGVAGVLGGGDGKDGDTWRFFDVQGDGGSKTGTSKGRGGGRKRKSSEAEVDADADADADADKDSEGGAGADKHEGDVDDDVDLRGAASAVSSVERVLEDIEKGAYMSQMKELWEAQLVAQVKLEDVIPDHYRGRDVYMSETAIAHALVVPKVVDVYKTCTAVVGELRAFKARLDGSESEVAEVAEVAEDVGGSQDADDVRRPLAVAEKHLQILIGLLTRPKTCDVALDGKGFRNVGDVVESVLVQVFTRLMVEIGLVAELNDICDAKRLAEQPSMVVGALSAMHVEFFSTLLERPGCYASGSVDVASLNCSAGLSMLASPDANPHFVAYKDYVARVESMLEADRVLARLAAEDWASSPSAPALLKLAAKTAAIRLTHHNVVGAGIGDALVEKCERALAGYLQAAGRPQGGVDEQAGGQTDFYGLEASLVVSLAILQRFAVATDPLLLEWWIPRSAAFYELLNKFVGGNAAAVLTSDVSTPAAQKAIGGLLVCANVDKAGAEVSSNVADDSVATTSAASPMPAASSSGLAEVVDVLSSHLPWVTIEDNTDGVMDASEYFDLLDATFIGSTVAVTISWDDVRLLVDDAEVLGQVLASMSILRSYLENSSDAAAVVQRLGGNELVMRALMCATEILAASRADDVWMHRVGTSMDVSVMASNKLMAIELFEMVTGCAYHYLKGIAEPMMREMRDAGPPRDRSFGNRWEHRGGRDVDRDIVADSLPLLQTLIKAHAAAAVDTQTMMDAGLKTSYFDSRTVHMRNARWNASKALRFWVSCSGLRPRVIPTALVGAVAAPSKGGCPVSFSPTAMLCLALLLGDIFPSEWPKPTSSNILTPEDKKYRASLTEELESCIVPLEYIISCCASSDLSYIRAATVRFLCKGAGLGGGMGTFLMGIISSQFDEALLPMTFAQVGMYDVRKVLELLVPLLYHPALKSAALDTTIPIALTKVVQTIITQSLTFGQAFDKVESSSLVTMALECLTALADPAITLDGMARLGESPKSKTSSSKSRNDRDGRDVPTRRNDASPDVLRRDAGAAICCTILDHITIIGENVPLAIKLLNTMAQDRRGRDSILHGTINLCSGTQAAKTAGAPQVAAEHLDRPTHDQMLAASCWLIQQYQTIQSNALHAPDAAARDTTVYVFGTLESILKRACVRGLHEDLNRDLDGTLPPMDTRTAPVKFAAQAKEATSRGEKARLVIDFPCNGGYTQLLQDCDELHVFWKNQSMRPIAPVSTVTNACKLSKYVNWDIGSETMDKFCIAGILHPWLTHPTRPLNESMRSDCRNLLDEADMDGADAMDPARLPGVEGKGPLKREREDGVDGDGDAGDAPQPMEGDTKDKGTTAGVKAETGLDQIDTQVNVDLGALPDLFRQQPPGEAQPGQDAEDDVDDDFDLYADLVAGGAPEEKKDGDEPIKEEPIKEEPAGDQAAQPGLAVKFSSSDDDDDDDA